MVDRHITLDVASYDAMTSELAELRQQVAALSQQNTALARQQSIFQAILDNIPHRVWLKDAAGKYQYANQAFGQVVGMPTTAILGKADDDIWTSEDSKTFQAGDAAVMQTRQSTTTELHLTLKEGDERWYMTTKSALVDQDDTMIGVAGIAIDITEQKQAELALRRSEAKFQAFLDNTPVPSWIVDRSGRMQYINSAYLQLQQVSTPNVEDVTDVIGKTLFELYDPEIAQQFHTNNLGVLSAGETIETLEITPRHDGSLGDFQVYKFPIPDLSGESVVGGIALDVTDRRRAEATLQQLNTELEARVEERTNVLAQTEQRLRRHSAAFQELVQRGTLEHMDLQTALRDITEAVCHGVDVERTSIWFYGDNCSDRTTIQCHDLYIHSQDTHHHGAELQATQYPDYFQALQTQRSIAIYDTQGDPRTHGMVAYLQPLGINSMLDVPIWFRRQVVGVICLEHVGDCRQWTLDEENFVTSITDIVRLVLEGQERQKVELALQNQAQLLDQVKGSIIATDMNGVITSWNQASETIYGYTAEEAIGQSVTMLYLPEHQELLQMEVIAPLLRQGQHDTEVKNLRKSGEVFDAWLSLSLKYDRQGNPVGMIGYSIDITDRKQTEAQLQEKEQFLRSIYDGVTSHIFVVDALPNGEFRFAGWNRAVEDMYHMPSAVCVGKTPSELFGDETGQLLCDRYRHCLQVGAAVTYEDCYIIQDRENWWTITLNPLHDETGRIYRLVGTALNITDRKQVELSLQDREEQYRAIFEAVTDGIEIYDLDTGEMVAANPATATMHGYTLEEFMTLPPEEFIHPDCFHLFGELLAAIRAGQTFQCYSINFRIGRVPFDVEVRANQMIYNGKPHVLAIVRDISDRKRAEAALQDREAFLRSIYDGLETQIFVYDVSDTGELRHAGWNACSEKIIGRSSQECEGKTFLELFGAIEGVAIQQRFIQCRDTGCSISYEESLTLQNQPSWWFTTLNPLKTEDGRVYRIVGTALDITKLKQAEAALQDALAEALGLNAILDNLVDGLLVTDTDGRVSRYNPALLNLYGLGNVNLLHEDVIDLPMPGLSDLLAQTYANPGEVFTVEVNLLQERVGQATATTIYKRSAQGDAEIWLGSAVLIRDVTVEREIDRMKTDFISTVSHELRTPLTSVLGFASIIKEKLEDDIFPKVQTVDRKLQRTLKKVDANISIIISEAERLTALINDVLDIAKMEAGKVEWQMHPLNPVEVIDQAIAATSCLFETSGLVFHRDVPPELPQVIGDRDRLIQVLINLISNAVKFTEQGSVTLRATTRRGEQIAEDKGQPPALHPSMLVISIIDTGMGIAPEDQPKVFEKFKQVGDTLTDKPKGTGLGLPICQQIVDYHGGSIWVESELGSGSTFSFSLPLNQEATSVVSLQSATAYRSLVQQLKEHVVTTAIAMPSERKTILVVDDDAHIRELLRQALELEGYIVQEAGNGMDAINQVKVARPDLIILDVMMPQINGFDVAAVLKNDPRSMGIPIIMLSIVEDRERGFRIGIDRYLTKPINTPQLMGDIQALLTQGMSNKKVLIVDQNASTAQTLSEVLRAQGYHVVEARDSEDCIEKAISHQPDMIIVDSMLSQQHNLVKTLRFEKGLENVFFVLLGDSHAI